MLCMEKLFCYYNCFITLDVEVFEKLFEKLLNCLKVQRLETIEIGM